MKSFSILSIVLLTVLVQTSVFAGVELTTTYVPTPGMPGWSTFTCTVTNDDGEITSISLDFTSTMMNQVNPFGMDTIFNDVPPETYTAVGADIAQDSHILFDPEKILYLFSGDYAAQESSTRLLAIFTGKGSENPLGFESRAVAQIVLPNGVYAHYEGEVVVEHAYLDEFNGDFGISGMIGVPEPASLGLLTLATLVMIRRQV